MLANIRYPPSSLKGFIDRERLMATSLRARGPTALHHPFAIQPWIAIDTWQTSRQNWMALLAKNHFVMSSCGVDLHFNVIFYEHLNLIHFILLPLRLRFRRHLRIDSNFTRAFSRAVPETFSPKTDPTTSSSLHYVRHEGQTRLPFHRLIATRQGLVMCQ